MNKIETHPVSFDEFDEINHPRPERTDFDGVAERFISRRSFLRGTAAMGASALILGAASLNGREARAAMGAWLDFEPVAANTRDDITVPKGFNSQVVVRWGDPLWTHGVPFDHETRGTGATQALAFGDNNDGMHLFNTPDGRTLLVVNNEYTNRSIIYGNRQSGLPENADDVLKGKYAHGISVVELRQEEGQWKVVIDSEYNRRITADTPM
ncbi:MAG TPA: alkaline phosphatase PhoX, partial [Alphaproteobacteria bacterium]|nr:alkaline phosphatase PhoX [Alphaproteobacteria bacterium]